MPSKLLRPQCHEYYNQAARLVKDIVFKTLYLVYTQRLTCANWYGFIQQCELARGVQQGFDHKEGQCSFYQHSFVPTIRDTCMDSMSTYG